MNNAPIYRAQLEVDEHLLGMCSSIEVQRRVDEIKMKLCNMLAEQMAKNIVLEKVPNHRDQYVTYVASLIGVSLDDWKANYANSYTRRGISDGTMAVMQNGNWHVVSNPSIPSYTSTFGVPTPLPLPAANSTVATTQPTPTKPKPFDPSEYLKNRVSELRS